MAGPELVADKASRQQVVQSASELLARMLRLGRPIGEDTNLMDELGVSSSQAMELLLELENELSISIDVDELDQAEMCTLGDLADYIVEHSEAL